MVHTTLKLEISCNREQSQACLGYAECSRHCEEWRGWHRCISLKYDFYKGTRRMKLLDSNQFRQLRDVCVFEVNDLVVFM